MAEKLTADKSVNLFRLVEERALSKKELDEENQRQQLNLVPYLPKDCISNILVRLPVESLPSSRFVCWPWYKIINSPIFIDAYLRRAETVLIFLSSFNKRIFRPYSTSSIPQEKPNTFSVEAKIYQLQSVHAFHQPLIDPTSKFHIKFMVIKDGKSKIGEFNATCLGKIRATCNGLILLDNKIKKGGLVVMNPVTRELSLLPVGTICPVHEESYGLAFCKSTGGYKVVHLFRDEMHFIGCEILQVGTRSWSFVDGPSFGLLSWFGYEPVSALEALHWVPHIDHSEYIVSLTMNDEKFHKILLPKDSRLNDRILEIAEFLGFVTHEEMNQIDVWILRNLSDKDWMKIYTITVGCIKDMVPLYCSRINWEMVFMDKDGSILAYDFRYQVMRKVELEKGAFPTCGFYLHVNSLISWQSKEKDQDLRD